MVWKEDALLPAMFNPLCSSTNQQLFKKNFCNQSSQITDDFCNKWKPSRAYHKINSEQNEWDTKEGRGKSMKNAFYVQWYGKRQLSGWSDVEQRKNQAHSLS